METFVTWDSSYNVGIDSVDKQHKHLIYLTNSLYNACLDDKAELDTAFKEVMKELVEYVSFHFKDEERIMEEVNYPGLQEHKQIHQQFIKKILAAVDDYQKGKQFVPNSFVRFLRDWLFNHILVNDKEMAKYYFSVKNTL